MSRMDLPEDRLATTDELGNRVYLYPADVSGRLHSRRRWIQAVLIILFLVLPWVKLGGHQILLLDITERKFFIFGLALWAHEVPMLFFVLTTITFGVALLTALFGRVWCGWACPQTVYIDGVFRRIERWVEGDAIQRRKLDQASWGLDKIFRKGLKWLLYAAFTIVITHSFLAYFVGSHRVLEMMTRAPSENWTSFLFVWASTAVLLFNFGWFREQFCVIVCPYGRIQSILMDEHSQSVFYDTQRGEPRRAGGDCIGCYRCVQVCPTGIDIRRGTQLECIACSACVDACDSIMEKVKKPKGLIRYTSEAELAGKKKVPVRLRTLSYAGLVLLFSSILAFQVARRKDLEVTLLRAKDTPYQEVKRGEVAMILNHFKVYLKNQSFHAAEIRIALEPQWAQRGYRLLPEPVPEKLEPGKSFRKEFFIEFPKSELALGKGSAALEVKAQFAEILAPNNIREELRLVGPY